MRPVMIVRNFCAYRLNIGPVYAGFKSARSYEDNLCLWFVNCVIFLAGIRLYLFSIHVPRVYPLYLPILSSKSSCPSPMCISFLCRPSRRCIFFPQSSSLDTFPYLFPVPSLLHSFHAPSDPVPALCLTVWVSSSMCLWR